MLGPTASGKTDLAIDLAECFEAVVVSVDSMQVYRGMDIGTAKPSVGERRGIPHHMVDIVDPGVEFSVAEFRAMAQQVIADTEHSVVIVGGSGLHFRSVVDPMEFPPSDPTTREGLERMTDEALRRLLLDADPRAGEVLDLENRRRLVRAGEVLMLTGLTPTQRSSSAAARAYREYVPELSFTAVGVDPGESLYDRVRVRLTEMREAGLDAEVAELWPVMGRTARGAVGYRELGQALEAGGPVDEAYGAAERATRALARRQRTWFRRDPRIRWIPWDDSGSERTQRALEVIG